MGFIQDEAMEVLLAAGGGMILSAGAAALKEDPALAVSLRGIARRLQSTFSGPSQEDLLQQAMRGLPVALDSSRSSIDGSRRGLRSPDLLRIASMLQTITPGTLRKLNLSHTAMSVDVAATFGFAHEGLSALLVLRLRGCSLGDGGVGLICEALHHPSSAASSPLTELALASNGLTPAAATHLADAVRELPSLVMLDLSYNELGSLGCVAIGEAISERRVLQSLSLAATGLHDEAVAQLAGLLSLTPLVELDLDGNAASDYAMSALLEMASRTQTLTTLRLSANAIGETGARALAQHLSTDPGGSLRSIALANNPIGLKGGEALRICMRVCRSVTDLSLTGAGVAAEQLKDIDECVAQNRSDLRVQSRQATKSLLRAAAQRAEERAAGIGTEGAAGVTAARADATAAPTAAATAAGRTSPASDLFATSTHLDFAPQTVGRATATHAASASTPSSIPGDRFAPSGDLSAGVVRQWRELSLLPSARLVLLDHAMISDEHADELAEYTRDNTCTELLHLGGNELTNEGLTVLAAALPTSSIRRLSLAGNNVQDEGALALGTALAKGFAPEHIDLSDNMLTDTGALGLVEQALKHGPALVWLDLRANPLITSEGRHEARAAAERARFELLL